VFSHAVNACPSRRTFGPKAHIQPNPRGRRSFGEAATGLTGAFASRVALRASPAGQADVSPASMRRISAESARSLVVIQF
jgi:hypothetical protein